MTVADHKVDDNIIGKCSCFCLFLAFSITEEMNAASLIFKHASSNDALHILPKCESLFIDLVWKEQSFLSM